MLEKSLELLLMKSLSLDEFSKEILEELLQKSFNNFLKKKMEEFQDFSENNPEWMFGKLLGETLDLNI